jgi:hypothetical protein
MDVSETQFSFKHEHLLEWHCGTAVKCIYVCMYVCMHACMYACMYVCVCVSMCVYVCIYVCMVGQNASSATLDCDSDDQAHCMPTCYVALAFPSPFVCYVQQLPGLLDGNNYAKSSFTSTDIYIHAHFNAGIHTHTHIHMQIYKCIYIDIYT